jgi:hypothetical protein
VSTPPFQSEVFTTTANTSTDVFATHKATRAITEQNTTISTKTGTKATVAFIAMYAITLNSFTRYANDTNTFIFALIARCTKKHPLTAQNLKSDNIVVNSKLFQ